MHFERDNMTKRERVFMHGDGAIPLVIPRASKALLPDKYFKAGVLL